MADEEQPIALPPISVYQLRMLEGRRAVSNEQLVQALVRFANTGSYAARGVLQLGVHPDDPMIARHGDGPLTKGIQPGQQELRAALDKIVKGNLPVSLAALWRRRAAGLIFLRVFVPGGTHLYRWEQFEQWESEPAPVIANALLLLLEEPFAGKLCRCGWAECQKFFFAVPEGRGRPVTEYCPGTNHRALARPDKVQARRAILRIERAKAKQSKRRRS